ncbi:hypothetical protein [Streptomyces sp. CBMA29]|uniref:hypothetical protein n=1 Tax=Streptomyces sp. CBMA29 TaxID=1896314 RepID=UPI001CB6F11F|nr:hypothetical protein [Streptomyces sp. CBMA29]MBD0739283.1 hypothetical protein [Streptomyces sp. CBMA29]
MVELSGGMGSLARTHDPARPESQVIAPLYTALMAALTVLTNQYAKDLPDIRVNAADPGCTATNLNPHSGPVALATETRDARRAHRPLRRDRPVLSPGPESWDAGSCASGSPPARGSTRRLIEARGGRGPG